MISLSNVSKTYHKRDLEIHALRPTDLQIESGEFVAIIGPSGSGKTTLLSILGGMLSPSTGDVMLLDENLYQLNARQRAHLRNESIGFVFQNFNLVPWLTAVENVQLPLAILGSDPTVQRTRALELLETFDLKERADHKPSELSAGQQQRVALARTLVMDPQLILADEPTGNLDPASKQIVLDTLIQFNRGSGRTIVLVTHDHSIAHSADRIIEISDGLLNEHTYRGSDCQADEVYQTASN